MRVRSLTFPPFYLFLGLLVHLGYSSYRVVLVPVPLDGYRERLLWHYLVLASSSSILARYQLLVQSTLPEYLWRH
jgi:hypothetical protein